MSLLLFRVLLFIEMRKNFKDLTGLRFKGLLVLKYTRTCSSGSALFECKCDCGVIKEIKGKSLLSGNTSTCGCRHKEDGFTAAAAGTKRRNHPLYNTWKSMKGRCNNKNGSDYKYYGGRGISVCERWRDSFTNFIVDMGERPKGYSIERINNDGNYEPGNCKWASKSEQGYNKRTTKLKPEWVEAAKQNNISLDSLYRRIIERKMPPEEAILKPMRANSSRNSK
jgi:hypothetical protein